MLLVTSCRAVLSGMYSDEVRVSSLIADCQFSISNSNHFAISAGNWRSAIQNPQYPNLPPVSLCHFQPTLASESCLMVISEFAKQTQRTEFVYEVQRVRQQSP